MEKAMPELYVMKGGVGPESYVQNSSYQKGGLEITRNMITETIATTTLDINHFSTPKLFVIADFGCSTGPNTFFVVQNIVEAVQLKYKQESSIAVPEFQVCFIDHVFNDFNTLFESLPPNRDYFAVGVPGSFHGRLLPRASVHFAHSSYTFHWLSKVPTELLDKSSPAWNKGRISHVNAPKEVVQAYSDQFARDTQSFLLARAQELLPGGLMALLLLLIPEAIILPSLSEFCAYSDFMGSVLMDMAKMGKLGEDEVDSFNLPIYVTTQKELKSIIERNGLFDIEKMEPLIRLNTKPEIALMTFRAAFGGIFEKHFANDIIQEMFSRLIIKAEESSTFLKVFEVHPSELFVFLKRK